MFYLRVFFCFAHVDFHRTPGLKFWTILFQLCGLCHLLVGLMPYWKCAYVTIYDKNQMRNL